MEDPLITLYDELLAEWDDVTVIPIAADIRFSTSWFDKDIQSPQITVTEVSTLDIPFDLGYGTVRVDAVYQVDIWVVIQRATDKGPQLAKEYIWAMRSEVKRILKAAHTGTGDIDLLLLNDIGRELDEPDATPPILRYSQRIGVVYSLT